MNTEELDNYLQQVESKLLQVKNRDEFYSIKKYFLGRDGIVEKKTQQFIALGKEQKQQIGPYFNKWKNQIITKLREFEKSLELETATAEERYDFTEEIKKFECGNLHPITKTIEQIKTIFATFGFECIRGREIEDTYHNFDALNTPVDHPAREATDTLYLTGNQNVPEQLLLRTHTSPMQVRIMEERKPPLRIIVPGKVYRDDAIDASHFPIFHQVEGLCVEENVSFADLKFVLTRFLQMFFEEDVQVRFRPSYFPFTEPSAEVDIGCIFCNKRGCHICKNSGWIEILGAGMVHPAVLKGVKIDPEIYSGFAFGVGIERLTMLKYKINDIRLFFLNRIDFLKQF
ncbi:MAG: phenylalanine--tRNA ligase subunit alpha [Planctomycetota bacterium]